MFKSISNNFGVPQITFRDFQTDRYIVLNARFTLDPSNEAYIAAQALEITVPDLTLDKSTEAGVFAVYRDEEAYPWDSTPSRYHFATILRSRITGRNTLSIEKLTDFDEYGPATIYIYAMYSALNTGLDTVLYKTAALKVTAEPQLSNPSFTSSCVITSDWVSLNMVMPYCISQVDTDLTLTMEGFPHDVSCDEFPVIGVRNQLHYDTGGVHYASLAAGRILIPYATRNAGYSSADEPFVSLVLVRDNAVTI